jgi:hypothetical protein
MTGLAGKIVKEVPHFIEAKIVRTPPPKVKAAAATRGEAATAAQRGSGLHSPARYQGGDSAAAGARA